MTSPGCGIYSDIGSDPATLTLTGTHFFGNTTGNASKTGRLTIS